MSTSPRYLDLARIERSKRDGTSILCVHISTASGLRHELWRTLRCIFCCATGFSVCSCWGLDLHLFGWSSCRRRHFCVWQSCLRREAGSTWSIEHIRRLESFRQLLNVSCACRGRCVHDWNLESVLHWQEDLCVLHIYSWLWCGAYSVRVLNWQMQFVNWLATLSKVAISIPLWQSNWILQIPLLADDLGSVDYIEAAQIQPVKGPF